MSTVFTFVIGILKADPLARHFYRNPFQSIGGKLLLLALTVALTAFLFLPSVTMGAKKQAKSVVTVITPQVHQDRLMKDVVDAFNRQDSGFQARVWQPRARSLDWPGLTDRVANKPSTLMFTSREDWNYRADDEDKQKLEFVPFARQLVFRGDEEVGYVEYGLLVPKDQPAEDVQAFMDFLKSSEAQAVLEKPDPYYYVTLDHDVVEFQKPDWFDSGEPGSGSKPVMWHGVSHIWAPQFGTTILGELKMMWMAGFNQAAGAWAPGSNDALLQWANDHSFILAQLRQAEGQEYVDAVSTQGQDPAIQGAFYRNEDFISRVYQPMYGRWYKHQAGEVDDLSEILKAFEAEYPEWLKQKHGSLANLNQRWGTSYKSWDEIGLPELPLDWVQELYPRAGVGKDGKLSKGRLMALFFHQPLHYTVLADHPQLLDLQRYMCEVWARKYKALSRAYGGKQFWETDYTHYADELAPLTGHGKFDYTTKGRLIDMPFLYRQVPEFTAAGYTHVVCNVPPHLTQVGVDTTQIATDKPLWNAEHHLYNNGMARPREVRYHLLHSYLMGMFRSSGYNRQTNFMSGRPDKAGHYASAERGAHYRAEVIARCEIRRHADVFRAFLAQRAKANIAVLVTEGNLGWNTLPDGPSRPQIGGAVLAYAYVGALGKPWKYVLAPDVSAEVCTGDLVVAAPWLTPETAQKIVDLPEDRRVIFVEQVPATDEYGQTLPQAQALKDRGLVVKSWNDLQSQAIEPAEGLRGAYTKVGHGNFDFWGKGAGGSHFTMPMPRLEVRRVERNGNLYVAITNHAGDSEVEAPLPWAGGHMIRELTCEDSKPRMYPEGEFLAFPPFSVRIFEIQGGSLPVGLWDYDGGREDPASSVGANLDKAYQNYQMGVNGYWNAARPKDPQREAWSIWKAAAPSSNEQIVSLDVHSRVIARKGKTAGELARVEWSLDPEGPWNTLYVHRFKAEKKRWLGDSKGGTTTLDDPVSAVYLRMFFKPTDRRVMWRSWKAVAQTTDSQRTEYGDG